jgi:hypothetical protein
MHFSTSLRAPARDVRARLFRPPNAVPDRGINLRRDTSPPPPKKTLTHEFPAWLPMMLILMDNLRKMKELEEKVAAAAIDQADQIKPIIRATAQHFGVKPTDLVSQRRTYSIVRPRQVAMYLAKTLTKRSLPAIGRRFGGRDHTTVMHAIRKIERLVATDPTVATEIEHIRASLS